MTKTVSVYISDGIDQIMPVSGGHTQAFMLPDVPSGTFLQVFNNPARETEYICGKGRYDPGDFVIKAMGRTSEGRTRVRIEAVPGGRLEQAASIYVVTKGNVTAVDAETEIYGEEDTGNA